MVNRFSDKLTTEERKEHVENPPVAVVVIA